MVSDLNQDLDNSANAAHQVALGIPGPYFYALDTGSLSYLSTSSMAAGIQILLPLLAQIFFYTLRHLPDPSYYKVLSRCYHEILILTLYNGFRTSSSISKMPTFKKN